MEAQSPIQPSEYEKTVIAIMRRLPPERLPYLVEFARFLEFRATTPLDAGGHAEGEEDFSAEEGVLANEAKWDELLAKPEVKRLMRELAREARAEYSAGNTTEIHIAEDGRLAPE
jgi:hypothetical protein